MTFLLEDPIVDRSVVAQVLNLVSSDEIGLDLDDARAFEPVRVRFSAADIPRIAAQWDTGPFYSRSSSTRVLIDISPGLPGEIPGAMSASAQASGKCVESFAKLAGAASGRFGGEIGFVECVGKAEAVVQARSGAADFLRRDGSEWALSLISIQLEEHLADVFWCMLFGQPYVEEIGLDRLLSAPAFRVEAIGETAVAIQLTEDPFDAVRFEAPFLEARERVKRHLGEDLFFRLGADGNPLPCRVPRIYLERQAARERRRIASELHDSGLVH